MSKPDTAGRVAGRGVDGAGASVEYAMEWYEWIHSCGCRRRNGMGAQLQGACDGYRDRKYLPAVNDVANHHDTVRVVCWYAQLRHGRFGKMPIWISLTDSRELRVSSVFNIITCTCCALAPRLIVKHRVNALCVSNGECTIICPTLLGGFISFVTWLAYQMCVTTNSNDCCRNPWHL